MNKEELLELKESIKNAKKIVFFGGAGVSTESGIKDFRSKDGLYNLQSKYGLPYETMLSHSYFRAHTDTFYDFYREFMITDAKPNYAHEFLALLEKSGKDVTVITQNIDGLHQMAGSKKVIELHGSIHRNYCERCGRLYDVNIVKNATGVPTCPVCGGEIKPDVVLYEEPLDERTVAKAMIALQDADLLIVAGTSLKVYPAAMYINYFYGNNVIVINKEKLDINRKIKLQISGKIGEIFKSLNYFDE